MPGINATLANHDLDFLNRTARFWKVEISQRDVSSAGSDLYNWMVNQENLQVVLRQLSEPAAGAWQELLAKSGRIPWAVFSRKYGDIRDFGPASRERENPDQNPVSVSETLWYSGLIGKAFLKVAAQLTEMVYVPDEILKMVSPSAKAGKQTAIRPAVNQKPKYIDPAGTSLLDHMTDVLAALRMSRALPDAVYSIWGVSRPWLMALLSAAGLIDRKMQPIPGALKTFLLQDRAAALLMLYQAWFDSQQINELRLLPGLVCEGSWENDVLAPRRLLVDLLPVLQPDTWWSISSLLSMVKEQTPDFQRPAGDYDSWFIRRDGTDQYLRGFEHWDDLDGRVLYFILTGPLHWLGIVNLARGEAGGKFTAFQLNRNSQVMLQGGIPDIRSVDHSEIDFKGSTGIILRAGASCELRYQVGRFCELSKVSVDETSYLLTPASLNAAKGQELHVNQLVQLLEKYRSKPIPEPFKRLAQRWQEHGLEAEIKTGVLLRFTSDEACAQFMQDPRAVRLTAEVLNPKTIMLHSEAMEGAQRLLSEMGILTQVEAEL